MGLCYVSFSIHTHAFYIERLLKLNSIPCEITYLPREILIEPCNMGVRFEEAYVYKAIDVLKQVKIPRMRLYKEVINLNHNSFYQIELY